MLSSPARKHLYVEFNVATTVACFNTELSSETNSWFSWGENHLAHRCTVNQDKCYNKEKHHWECDIKLGSAAACSGKTILILQEAQTKPICLPTYSLYIQGSEITDERSQLLLVSDPETAEWHVRAVSPNDQTVVACCCSIWTVNRGFDKPVE